MLRFETDRSAQAAGRPVAATGDLSPAADPALPRVDRPVREKHRRLFGFDCRTLVEELASSGDTNLCVWQSDSVSRGDPTDGGVVDVLSASPADGRYGSCAVEIDGEDATRRCVLLPLLVTH